MLKKKIVLAVGLLVMLLALTGCQSGSTGDELAQSVNDSNKSEVFIKVLGNRIVEFEQYDIYEVGKTEKINGTDLDLEFYFNGEKRLGFTTTEEEVKKMNTTTTLVLVDWLEKFELEKGTYDLEIRDKKGNLKNNYKGQIVVEEGETIVEINIGEYTATGIDIGEIELEEK